MEITVTHLRKLMLDELQRRNYAQNSVRAYIHAVEDFARYFHLSPDRLGPEHIREYQVHLFRDCKLCRHDRRSYCCSAFSLRQDTPMAVSSRSHSISQASEAVTHSTESGGSDAAPCFRAEPDAPHHADAAVCDRLATPELCHLKVCDIDRERMVIHGRRGT